MREIPAAGRYIQRLPRWFRRGVGGIPYRACIRQSGSPLSAGRLDRPGPGALSRAILSFRSSRVTAALAGFDALTFACALAFLLASLRRLPSWPARARRPIRALPLRRPGALALDRIAFRIASAFPGRLLAGRGSSAAASRRSGAWRCTEAADTWRLPLEEFRRAYRRDGRGARRALGVLVRQGRPPVAIAIVGCLALVAAPSLMLSVALSLVGSLARRFGIRPAHFAARPQASLHSHAHRHRKGPTGRRLFGRDEDPGGSRLRMHSRMGAMPRHSRTHRGRARRWTPPFPALSWPRQPEAPDFRGTAARPFGERPDASRARPPSSSTGRFKRPCPMRESERSARTPSRLRDADAPGVARRRRPTARDRVQRRLGSSGIQGRARPEHRGDAPVPGLGDGGARGFGLGGGGRPLAPIDLLLYIFLLVPLCGRLLVGVPFARDAASGELRQEA